MLLKQVDIPLFDLTKEHWLKQLQSLPNTFPKEAFGRALESTDPRTPKVVKTVDYALLDKPGQAALAFMELSRTRGDCIKVTSIVINPKDSKLGDESSRFVEVMTEVIVNVLKLSEGAMKAKSVKILGKRQDAYLFLRVLGGLIKRSRELAGIGLDADNYGIWLELKKH